MNHYTVSRGDKKTYNLLSTLAAFEQGARKRGQKNGKENRDTGTTDTAGVKTEGSVLATDSPSPDSNRYTRENL